CVDLRRASEQKLRLRAHQPERNDGMTWLERAGRGLGQQRCVEHEVLRADDRRAAITEESRDVAAGETAAHDERSAPPPAHGCHAAYAGSYAPSARRRARNRRSGSLSVSSSARRYAVAASA